METSQNTSSDPQPDWAQLLPREAFYEIARVLRGALPPPDQDAPLAWERRDRAAVGALRPGTAAEGRLAAQFVMADAWAMDCLRLAGERRLELEIARKCRAQALSMMREGKSALRLLLKVQAERRAIEADAAASDRAAWEEHSVMAMMQEALSPAPAEGGVDVSRKPPVAGRDEGSKYGQGSDRAMRSRATRHATRDGTEDPLGCLDKVQGLGPWRVWAAPKLCSNPPPQPSET